MTRSAGKNRIRKKRTGRKALRLAAVLFLCCALISCGEASAGTRDGTGGGRTTLTEFPVPVADGGKTAVSADGAVDLDYSHTEDGYVCIRYTGDAEKVQIQITNPDGTLYPYPLRLGEFETFPLTGGSGAYRVAVMVQVTGDTYAVGLSESIDVTLSDAFAPYLRPNQYVTYTAESACVKLGRELSDTSADDFGYIGNVYRYVTGNVTYDKEFAASAPVGYIPDPDTTLSTGTGICFDYASLMTAMLRSQGIPTRLEVGYSGTIYHAWISVYLAETGWVEKIIEFDGTSWTLIDPTLGANNSDSSVKKYISDGSNYTVKYSY